MSAQSKAIGKAMKARRLEAAGYEVKAGVVPCVRSPKHTQKAYAKAIGVSSRIYQDWEAGRYTPTRYWDKAIKKLFGASVEQLEDEGA